MTTPQQPGGTIDLQAWLARRLAGAGLSPDQVRGILAMNQVEGGAQDAQSLLGFTESQAQGPEGHVQAFLRQWNDPSRRLPGGGIPGVAPNGQVTDWNAYMTWIRQKIVGQGGATDWQGAQQPAAADYQKRLMAAAGRRSGGPAAQPATLGHLPTSGYGTRWHLEVHHKDGTRDNLPLQTLSRGTQGTNYKTRWVSRPGDTLEIVSGPPR